MRGRAGDTASHGTGSRQDVDAGCGQLETRCRREAESGVPQSGWCNGSKTVRGRRSHGRHRDHAGTVIKRPADHLKGPPEGQLKRSKTDKVIRFSSAARRQDEPFGPLGFFPDAIGWRTVTWICVRAADLESQQGSRARGRGGTGRSDAPRRAPAR